MSLDGFDCLGAADIEEMISKSSCKGFIPTHMGDDILSTILKAGASVAQGAIEAHQAGDEEAKQTAAAHSKLEEAKAKDAQAAVAIAHAIVSAALGSKTSDSDSRFADKALSDAKAARGALSGDDLAALDSARQSQLAQATARAQASPNDGYKKALATAWARVSTDGAASPRAGDPSARNSKQESFFTRRVLGPFSGSAVLAGGGGLALTIAAIVFSRRG